MREIIEFDLPVEIASKINALPDTGNRGKKIEPTLEQVEIIKRYWDTKPKRAICRIMGVAENTVRRWIAEGFVDD